MAPLGVTRCLDARSCAGGDLQRRGYVQEVCGAQTASDTADSVTIRGRDGRLGYYQVDYYVAKQMFKVKNGNSFRWSRQDGNVLLLTGTVGE